MSRARLRNRFLSLLDHAGLSEPAFRVYEAACSLARRPATGMHGGFAIPPPSLLMKVAGSGDPAVYLDGGQAAAETVLSVLAAEGVRFTDLESVLDFGCGCGRVLRHWAAHASSTRISGTDYNRDLVAWCQKNLPFARVSQNEPEPPAPFENGTFDFIYAFSVFTHLPEESGLRWMRELHRLLRPGALLLVSTHGAHYLSQMPEAEQEQFRAGGLVTRYARAAGSNLCSVFHPESYVRRVLAEGFEVLHFLPEGARGNLHQDAWLLRRQST